MVSLSQFPRTLTRRPCASSAHACYERPLMKPEMAGICAPASNVCTSFRLFNLWRVSAKPVWGLWSVRSKSVTTSELPHVHGVELQRLEDVLCFLVLLGKSARELLCPEAATDLCSFKRCFRLNRRLRPDTCRRYNVPVAGWSLPAPKLSISPDRLWKRFPPVCLLL